MGYYTVTITIQDEDINAAELPISELEMCDYLENSVCNDWGGLIPVGDEDYIDIRSFSIKATRAN